MKLGIATLFFLKKKTFSRLPNSPVSLTTLLLRGVSSTSTALLDKRYWRLSYYRILIMLFLFLITVPSKLLLFPGPNLQLQQWQRSASGQPGPADLCQVSFKCGKILLFFNGGTCSFFGVKGVRGATAGFAGLPSKPRTLDSRVRFCGIFSVSFCDFSAFNFRHYRGTEHWKRKLELPKNQKSAISVEKILYFSTAPAAATPPLPPSPSGDSTACTYLG